MVMATAAAVGTHRDHRGSGWRGGLGKRLGASLATLTLVLVTWLLPGLGAAAFAADNPQLLPDHPTPVIDLAKALTDGERGSWRPNWRVSKPPVAGS